MAQSLHDAQLWLATNSQFLPAQPQHLLAAKENFKNGINSDLDAALSFPSEFPYDFDSFGLSSPPVESVAGSTETESSDEEDFFAGLTRRLSQSTLHETRKLTTLPISSRDKAETQKTSGMARSPQSILSGIGSWSGRSAVSGDGSPNGPSQVPSPPTTPFPSENDAWDVIYAAAGQVARLKMNGEASSKYDLNNRGLLGPPRAATPLTAASLYSNQNLPQVPKEEVMKQQYGSVWGRQAKANWLGHQQQQQIQKSGYQSVKCASGVCLPQSSWPPLHQNRQGLVQPNVSASRAVFNGGSGVKRGCAGTGVFLPRQYGNPPESRKKQSCPPVQLPAKVVHALNLNLDDLNANGEVHFSGGFVADYDALIARRNAPRVMHQRLSVRPEDAVLNHELRLPQEWTY
ncbi:TIP41-like protein [Senna tora]|uniref:TIP41-like protein n=1 Tax=Senna tora TaxID=362788 RepID=A0A834T7A2_9FABA|nr:TIP41-like protein [Senna tora]